MEKTKAKYSFATLKYAKECKRACDYARLGLSSDHGQVSAPSVVKQALACIANSYCKGSSAEEIKKEVFTIMENFPAAEEYELTHACEQEKVHVCDRLSHLTDFLFQMERQDIIPSARVSVEICQPFSGVLSDAIDLVFFSKESVKGIKFSFGKNPFSDRARKPENFPSRNPILAVMSLGLKELYPGQNVVVEEWYLTGKDDKNDVTNLFEYKKGANICSYSFSDGEESLALSFNAPECGDCDSCRFQTVCTPFTIRDEGEVASSYSSQGKKQFTEDQQKVIEHVEGPLAVVAVPGSGKTTALVYRLLKLKEKGIPMENVLMVTFTKKAAREIKDRLTVLVGEHLPEIQTFHSFGYNLLRENPGLVGRRIKLANKTDQKKLVKECLDELQALQGMSYANAFLDYGIVNSILRWMAEYEENREVFNVKSLPKIKDPDGFFKLYALYQKKFKELSFINYDEMISLVNDLFIKYPKFLKRVAEKYQFIMVDEFQDTSDDQAAMIYSIGKCHNNLVVVGDDDQSIYRWRGGSSKFLLHFKEDFPQAKFISLCDNFRSNGNILDAANAVISSNSGERYQKILVGHKEAKFLPIFIKNGSCQVLAEWVRKLLTSYQPGNIAVLARKNKALEDVANVLTPFVKVTSPKDYLIKDGLFQFYYALMGLYLSDGSDDIKLYQLLKCLGAESEIPLKSDWNKTLLETIQESCPMFNLNRLDINALAQYQKMEEKSLLLATGEKILKGFKKMMYLKSFPELFLMISEVFDLPAEHKVYDALEEIIDEHAIIRIKDLYDYMSDMIQYSDDKRVGYDPCQDAVNLLTAHDSKGKEFPVVLVYGIEEFDISDEEGNRLLYVAMTRARDTLLLFQSPFTEQNTAVISVLSDKVSVKVNA